MVDYIFLVLLVVHVLAVVGWMGAAFLFSSVLGPSLRNMTSTGRAEFLTKVIPRYRSYVFLSSVAAVIFGLALYGYTFLYSKANFPSTMGAYLVQIGAAVGLIAFIVTLALVLPSARNLERMLKESQSSAPSGQTNVVDAAQARVRVGTAAVGGLLLIVLILMVVGATI